MIKEYFANYFLHMSRRDVRHGATTRWRCTSSDAEPWRVTLVDTGDETMTGGRLQARARLRRRRGRSASPTATASPTSTSRALIELPPRARQAGDGHRRAAAGALRRAASIDGDSVVELQREAARRRRLDQRRLLRALARGARLHRRRRRPSGSASRSSAWPRDGQLSAFRHAGFWQPMDTLRDKRLLEELWAVGTRAVEDVGRRPPRLLARPARLRHRPHRLQGRLAGAVAGRDWAPR